MAQRNPPDDDPLSSLVHDLQNVLTVIRGHAQIIQRRLARGEAPSPDRLAMRLSTIDDATRRMALTIGRLREVNRRQDRGDEASPPRPPPDSA